YTVFYTFEDANSCFNLDSAEVCVIHQPLAGFSIDTMIGCQPLTVVATNTSNTLQDCNAADYRWTVQFNGAACHADSSNWSFLSGSANSIDASFLFNLSGEYTISLEVSNNCNQSVFSRTITVGAPPSAVLEPLPDLCNEFTISPNFLELSDCNNLLTNVEWTFSPDASLAFFNDTLPPVVTFDGLGTKTVGLTLSNGCGSDFQSISFDIFGLPTLSTSNDGPACVGDDVQLSANSNTGTLYSWTGPNNFTATSSSPLLNMVQLSDVGTYRVTVTDANTGCTRDSFTTITVNALPLVDAGVDQTFCPDDGLVQLNASPGGITGTWSGGSLSPGGQFDPATQAGQQFDAIYTFVDELTLCSASDTLVVNVFPAALEEFLADSLCADQSRMINGTLYDINNPRGTEVFASAISGCDSLRLEIDLAFRVLEFTPTVEMPSCFGDLDGSIIVDTITGGVPPYVLNLNGAPLFVVDTFPFRIERLSADRYELIAEDINGCQVIDDVFVQDPEQVELLLGDDIDIEQGDSVELDAMLFPLQSLSPLDSLIQWTPELAYYSCNGCLTPIVQPMRTTQFTATFINENGCVASDEIRVNVDTTIQVYIPNAFSPNGDGVNDHFRIYLGQNVQHINKFQIFSRWGELVYEARDFDFNNVNLGWDGRLDGKLMNPAVFVFWAEVVKIDGTTAIVKGDLTLMR
ncbi:MAG: gliding motility-associated C-terminal domain-containing protein, partial [Bacteroidota bacterium]